MIAGELATLLPAEALVASPAEEGFVAALALTLAGSGPSGFERELKVDGGKQAIGRAGIAVSSALQTARLGQGARMGEPGGEGGHATEVRRTRRN